MYDVTYNEILERMLSRVSDKFDKIGRAHV